RAGSRAGAPPALRTGSELHAGIGFVIGYPLPGFPAMIAALARLVGGAEYRLAVLAGGRPASAGRPRPFATASSAGQTGMFIDLTDDQVALRDEVRSYFAGLISATERDAMRTDRHGKAYQQLIRRMGSDGWLGVGWPAEYGGRGFGQIEQQIFVTEAARADVPLPAGTR